MKSPFKRIRSRPGSASYSRQASNRAPCGSLIDMLRFARPVPVPPESSLWDLIEQKTGHTLSKEHFANWEHRKEKEHRQRIAVMRALGKAGRQNLHAEQDTIAIVGLMSGHAEPVVKTPRWSCFSWVARAQRRELLTNLAFYLAHRPECRHLRITLGPRVPLEEIGNALRSLAKAISRLNTRPWFREKAEIVARSCELTWNGATAHVHAHIVVRPLREVAEADWIALEGRVRGHCRGDIGSFEPLGDIARAVPYFAKGTALDGMTGDEIRIYAKQLRHVRTHEPLGEFRAFCQELTKSNRKLVRQGRCIVCVNRSDGLRRRSQRSRANPRSSTKAPPPTNQVVRLGPPRPHGTARFEPVLYVRNYDGRFAGVLAAYPDLGKVRENLMPQWSPIKPSVSNVPCIVQLTDQPASGPSPATSNSRPSPSPRSSLTSCCGTVSVTSSRSVTSTSKVRAKEERIAHPATDNDTDDNADVAPATRAPMSRFLRSDTDRYRQYLEEEPSEHQRQRKPRRSGRAPYKSTGTTTPI
jgi:hypothetical protein